MTFNECDQSVAATWASQRADNSYSAVSSRVWVSFDFCPSISFSQRLALEIRWSALVWLAPLPPPRCRSGEHALRADIFFLFVSISSGSPSLTNFFSLTLSCCFFSQPPSRQSLHRCHCPARFLSSRSSIDLFRDPRLLLEIDSDISAPEGLLKLHTFPVTSSSLDLPVRLCLSICLSRLLHFPVLEKHVD